MSGDNPFAKVAPEITRYFERKGERPTNGWRDFAPEEHAHAFTVARTAGYDVLADIREAMGKAIRERQSFEEFRASIEPTLKAKGWWGKAIDPKTGDEVQLGSVRRLKTIYWANTQTAWAAGEWEKIERAKRVLPYLLYMESTAEKKRPEHLAWVGTILPVDDPWWKTHYPPNGWGCMCRVRQISESEARARGYRADAPQRPPDFGARDFVNRRTGEVMTTPQGIDPGWQTNPGLTRARNAANHLAGKIDAMPEDARRAAVADIADSWLMRNIVAGDVPYDLAAAQTDRIVAARGRIAAPVAVLPPEHAAAIGASTKIVELSASTIAKQRANKERQAFTTEDYGVLQALIETGEAILSGARAIIYQGRVAGRNWKAVVTRPGSEPGEVFFSSLVDAGRNPRLSKARAKGRKLDETSGE